MSGWIPQVADWMRDGLDWIYAKQATFRVFELGPGEMRQVPTGHTYRAPEGVILQFSGGFSHPKCGIRIEVAPELDTEDFFTVEAIALGLNLPEALIYAMVPPTAPPGWYGIRIISPWVWRDWCRLYLFNADTVPHRCMGHGYHLLMLREKRKELGGEGG